MLISARLVADVLPDNPNANGVRAYFGEDASLYAVRSPASHVDGSNVPVLVAVAEHENTHLDRYGREFHADLLASNRTAPARFVDMPRHNHTSIVAHFNSGEETLGRPARWPSCATSHRADRNSFTAHPLFNESTFTRQAFPCQTQHNAPPNLFAPALTPFNADLTVNTEAFIDPCRWLISQGAGLAVFGTNSEANSLGLEEKITFAGKAGGSECAGRPDGAGHGPVRLAGSDCAHARRRGGWGVRAR